MGTLPSYIYSIELDFETGMRDPYLPSLILIHHCISQQEAALTLLTVPQ